MGFSIGERLIDDFLAQCVDMPRCKNFQETADMIAKVGFKMYLGCQPTVSNWSADHKEFSLVLDDNPLASFVELPEERAGLSFSNILCGVLRGALEMVQLRVDVSFEQDALRGDPTTSLRLKLLEVMADEAPPGDD